MDEAFKAKHPRLDIDMDFGDVTWPADPTQDETKFYHLVQNILGFKLAWDRPGVTDFYADFDGDELVGSHRICLAERLTSGPPRYDYTGEVGQSKATDIGHRRPNYKRDGLSFIDVWDFVEWMHSYHWPGATRVVGWEMSPKERGLLQVFLE